MNKDELVKLEELIDKYNLSTVIEAISNICLEKEEHLRSNWQDHQSAKVWAGYAKIIAKTADKVA